jgi:hypothetical protein
MQVLNFYSTIFADELKRGRKTATIRLGDKSGKYRKNQAVLVTIGYQYSPRERIFEAVIDQVEVMKLADLSPRDIKHDNPEFRRHEELINFLEQIYGRAVSTEDVVTVVRFSQILENPTGMTEAIKGFGGAQNLVVAVYAWLRCGGCARPRVCVQGLGGDVGVVGPDDRAGLGVRAELREVGGVAQRLEHAAIVEYVGEVYVRGGAVLEPNMHRVPVQRAGLDEHGSAAHGRNARAFNAAAQSG